jgi:hypothetical protein
LKHAAASDPRTAPECERRVLIVEWDEVQARRLLRTLHPSPVRIATTGDEALRVLRSCAAIELLITAIDPVGPFDGLALARQARALRPGLRVVYTSMFPVALREDDFTNPDGELLLLPASPVDVRCAVDRLFKVVLW